MPALQINPFSAISGQFQDQRRLRRNAPETTLPQRDHRVVRREDEVWQERTVHHLNPPYLGRAPSGSR